MPAKKRAKEATAEPKPKQAEAKAGAETIASCHCGAVTITLARAPAEVTLCNCSLCRRLGVLWAYYPSADVVVAPDPPATDTYAWNGRHVDFHRCSVCGCLTHWSPRSGKRDRRGINARLLPPSTLAAARVRHLDGAST